MKKLLSSLLVLSVGFGMNGVICKADESKPEEGNTLSQQDKVPAGDTDSLNVDAAVIDMLKALEANEHANKEQKSKFDKAKKLEGKEQKRARCKQELKFSLMLVAMGIKTLISPFLIIAMGGVNFVVSLVKLLFSLF